MVWRERKDHFRDCYSCLTNVKDFFAKSTHGIQYQNLHAAIRPFPHDGFAFPKPPVDWTFDDEVEDNFSGLRHGTTTGTACQEPDFFPPMSTSHHLITQQEFNDLVRDVNLSQTLSEFLA
jgi:hypothetical protein